MKSRKKNPCPKGKLSIHWKVSPGSWNLGRKPQTSEDKIIQSAQQVAALYYLTADY